MTWSRLDLGVGIIALGSLDQLWAGIADLVDVVEVEPQTLWIDGPGGAQQIAPEPLEWLRGCGRPLLAHGVGFPVGGTQAPNRGGVRAAARSARDLGAVHWSEHLAFNTVGDAYAGFLLPPVQTPEAVAAAVGHIGYYQELYDRPFLVETPTNYLRPVPGDLDDGAYVAEIAEQADCGVLLGPAQHLDEPAQRAPAGRGIPCPASTRTRVGGPPGRWFRDRRLLPRRARRRDSSRAPGAGRQCAADTAECSCGDLRSRPGLAGRAGC